MDTAPRGPTGIDWLLAAGWMVAAAMAAAVFFFGGFYGWAAIFAWGLLGWPLARATARRAATRGQPLAAECQALGRRSYALVAVVSLAAGTAPAVLEGVASATLGGIAVAIGWVAIVGQLAYVATATPWLLRHLLARH